PRRPPSGGRRRRGRRVAVRRGGAHRARRGLLSWGQDGRGEIADSKGQNPDSRGTKRESIWNPDFAIWNFGVAHRSAAFFLRGGIPSRSRGSPRAQSPPWVATNAPRGARRTARSETAAGNRSRWTRAPSSRRQTTSGRASRPPSSDGLGLG